MDREFKKGDRVNVTGTVVAANVGHENYVQVEIHDNVGGKNICTVVCHVAGLAHGITPPPLLDVDSLETWLKHRRKCMAQTDAPYDPDCTCGLTRAYEALKG